ncbi:hypothetical protein VNO77_27126 [Canavalia gladiata]|uniref:Uncharacterized protein n=1 Tax=Canavalia gladiata TaxID=3824 RepID=A0AAN9QA81_CANGL
MKGLGDDSKVKQKFYALGVVGELAQSQGNCSLAARKNASTTAHILDTIFTFTSLVPHKRKLLHSVKDKKKNDLSREDSCARSVNDEKASADPKVVDDTIDLLVRDCSLRSRAIELCDPTINE